MVASGDEIPRTCHLWLVRCDALTWEPKADKLQAVIKENTLRACKRYLGRSTDIQKNRAFEKMSTLSMYTKYILCLLLPIQQTVDFLREHRS